MVWSFTLQLSIISETNYEHYCKAGNFHVKKSVSNFRVKFLCSRVGYKNLTCIQLFNMCMKSEHGGAVKTLLHLKLARL